VASVTPGAELGTVSHYNVQNVIDIYANVDGTDLGTVTRAMEKIVARHQKDLPKGSQFILRCPPRWPVSSGFSFSPIRASAFQP
jgi:multidrug efflux pump subunit AcrB